MNRRLFAQAAGLAGIALMLPAAAFAQAAATRNRIIIQMSDNDPAKWNLALNNAKNLQDDVGAANVDMEIVAYGPGINMLKADSAVAARISEAKGSGVRIVACENTMKAMKLVPADMLPDVGYVPAGVVEVVRKQQAGWAYVRP